MGDMSFLPATITVNVGQRVVWKNTSWAVHNVVDDASKAISVIDVKLPAGVSRLIQVTCNPGKPIPVCSRCREFTATFALSMKPTE